MALIYTSFLLEVDTDPGLWSLFPALEKYQQDCHQVGPALSAQPPLAHHGLQAAVGRGATSAATAGFDTIMLGIIPGVFFERLSIWQAHLPTRRARRTSIPGCRR